MQSCRGNRRERCSNLTVHGSGYHSLTDWLVYDQCIGLRGRFVSSLDGFERESPAAWRISVLEPIKMTVGAEHIKTGIPAHSRSQPDVNSRADET